MHPAIAEIARVGRGDVTVRGEVFGRWQNALVREVQPMLDEHEVLTKRVAELEAQLAKRQKVSA